MERRRGVRFDIHLTCRLQRDGTYEMVDAITLNLGRLGALIEIRSSFGDSKSVPGAGDPVKLEVLLPAHQQFGQRCLSCDAVAVRASNDGGRHLIALQFERLEIREVLTLTATAVGMAVM